MKVYELREDSAVGHVHGLYASRELAERTLGQLALAGRLSATMHVIDEREVEEGLGGLLSTSESDAIEALGGPWRGDERQVRDGNGCSLAHINGCDSSIEEDAVIAGVIARLVNTAMGWVS